MSDGERQPGGRDQQRMEVPPTALEWVVRAASVALLALVVGYLVYQALQPAVPPTFTTAVLADRVSRDGDGYALPVRIRNEGSASVAELTVHVALRDGDGVVGEESITLELLGHGEQVTVVTRFPVDPRLHQVEVEVGSFREA